MFLYTAYAANVVALLQSSDNNINSVESLLNSRLQCGSHNAVYNKFIFNVSYYVQCFDVGRLILGGNKSNKFLKYSFKLNRNSAVSNNRVEPSRYPSLILNSNFGQKPGIHRFLCASAIINANAIRSTISWNQ